MRMPSVMAHTFSQVPRADIPRSSFDRSHAHKTTFDSGLLIPIFVEEALPGDTYSVQMTGFCRLATPLHPYMDNSYFNTFFFFVPYRLLWDNWAEFNGEQKKPGDSTDFLIPQVTVPAAGTIAPETIYDYMGLPANVAFPLGLKFSALPLRAYNLIWNEWFRDENLQDPVLHKTDDGPDLQSSYSLMRRGKRHDYFTSCLPWPQKGQSVSIPLGTSAPVVGSGTKVPLFTTVGNNPATQYQTIRNVTSSTLLKANPTYPTVGGVDTDLMWVNPQLQADLSLATAATINQLRQAFQIQKLYERDARGGTRYTEIVRSHFGVVSPDARLQRPEYLGGGQSPVTLHTVPQTAPPGTGDTPQANLAAYGTTVMSNHGFSKSFTEHGVLIGLVCVRADLTYQAGLDRMWSRRSRFDFYWPALAQIGEQAVLNKEIWTDGTGADENVFGYQERYAEYRYKPSKITGEFRSNHPTSLDTWHLSQDFGARPMLNDAFIKEHPPFPRVIAVTNEPEFIGDFYFKMRCARPMPVFGVPGLIDHF